MIEQQGRVVAVDANRVVVRVGAGSGCAACDAGRGCAAGLFGRLLRRKPVLLALDNEPGARSGQAVILGLPEAWLLRWAAKFYLYPVLAGLVGALFGHYLSGELETGVAVGDVLTLLGALTAASLPVWWNRRRSLQVPREMPVQLLRVID